MAKLSPQNGGTHLTKIWHQQSHTAHDYYNVMNTDSLNTFMNKTPHNRKVRFMMRSVQIGAVAPSVIKKTVLNGIKKGHVDVEVWCYANLMQPEKRDNGNGYYKTVWVGGPWTQSFVIDFDNLQGVSSCEELVLSMRVKKMPLPFLIVHTGPNNFHAMYYGTRGQWPARKRAWIAAKWAQVPAPEQETPEFLASLRSSGIDVSYFKQPYGGHKFRVPGTINPKYIQDGVYWTCESWSNQKYDNAEQEYYAEVGQPRPNYVPAENVQSITSVTSKPFFMKYNPDVHREAIRAMLDDRFPYGLDYIKLDDLENFICRNLGHLMKNDMRINQEISAAEWGCTQPDVSRLLKGLVAKGLLTKVSDSYKIKGWSKTYGAGDVLRNEVGCHGQPIAPPEWVRWDTGTSHYRMLYDVRYFVSLGMETEDIIVSLQERQAHRTSYKRRPVSEMLRLIKQCREFNKKIAENPIKVSDSWEGII